MKYLIIIGLLLYIRTSGWAQSNDTFRVYFPFNDSLVGKEATSYIDSLLESNTLIPGQKLIILGYADYVGGVRYNESLSMARATKVKDFLLASGFEMNDIMLYVGKGKIDRAPVDGLIGYNDDRKALIIIDRTPPARDTVPEYIHVEIPLLDTLLFDVPAAALKDTVPFLDYNTIKINETIALRHILFIGGNDIMLDESLPELNKLYEFLNEHKTVTIRIEGHICCNKIDDPYNRTTLSAARAMAVYNYLIDKGIDENRLSHIGYGHTRPLVDPERTEMDRTKNRRVEIRILTK